MRPWLEEYRFYNFTETQLRKKKPFRLFLVFSPCFVTVIQTLIKVRDNSEQLWISIEIRFSFKSFKLMRCYLFFFYFKLLLFIFILFFYFFRYFIGMPFSTPSLPTLDTDQCPLIVPYQIHNKYFNTSPQKINQLWNNLCSRTDTGQVSKVHVIFKVSFELKIFFNS